MHELSIATSIRTSVEELARQRSGQKIQELVLEIGELSGIEVNSLLFLWEECMRGSILEHAKVEIVRPLGEGRCKKCHKLFPMPNLYTLCPNCQSPEKEIISGQSLRIKRLSFAKEE